MYIEIWYGVKNFGNDSDKKQYTFVISQAGQSKGLNLEFVFANEFGVRGGRIQFPRRQAAEIATSILWFCQQLETESSVSPIEFEIDEGDIKSLSVPAIQLYDLARLLKIQTQKVIEEAKKLGFQTATVNSIIPLDVAETIRKKLDKDPAKGKTFHS